MIWLLVDSTLYAKSPRNSGDKDIEHDCLLSRMYDLLGKTLYLDTGESLSLSHEEANLGLYLKLHGSIDWFYCPNPGCGYHQQFFPNRIGGDSLHNKSGDLCNLCGTSVANVIVPPTMYKTFEKFPKLGFLWSLAYRELSKANKIVIWGVSFAPSDYYLRWLFKKAITEREDEPVIFNINKDASVSEKIKEITGCQPKCYSTTDEYLKKSKTT